MGQEKVGSREEEKEYGLLESFSLGFSLSTHELGVGPAREAFMTVCPGPAPSAGACEGSGSLLTEVSHLSQTGAVGATSAPMRVLCGCHRCPTIGCPRPSWVSQAGAPSFTWVV